MSGPRNRPGFERAQRLRTEIERIWHEREAHRAPFARPTAAKDIARELAINISLSSIRRHMLAIRRDAEVAAALVDKRATREFTMSSPSTKNKSMSASINCDDDEEPADGCGPR